MPLDDAGRLRALACRDDWASRLADADLFRGDLGDPAPQVVGVVQGDRRDQGEHAVQRVGRVQPSAHSGLEDRDPDPGFGEMERRQGGDDLEEGGPFRGSRQDPSGQARHRLLGDLLPVAAEALREGDEMGRGEETGTVAAGAQHGGEQAGGRPLAVGADHVDGGKAVLGITQRTEQASDPGKPGFDPEPAEGIYVRKGLLVGHDRRGL